MELGPRISLLALLLLLAVSASYAKCLKRTPIGGKCKWTLFCKLPGVCDADTKQCRAPAGEKCQNNDHCVSGFICHSGSCKRLAGLGEKCADQHAVCDHGMQCDANAGDVCRKNVGAQCQEASDCVTTLGIQCFSGICRGCETDKNCSQETKCDPEDFTCRIPHGAACGEQWDCWTASICKSGRCECGGEYNTSGVIITPNYPNSFPADLNCIWTIRAPADYVIKMDFTDFDLTPQGGCKFQSVTITDGETPGVGQTKDGCGSIKPAILQSTGNVVHVQFTVTLADLEKGFRLEFSFVSAGNP